MGHIKPDQLGSVMLGGANDLQRDHSLLHDPLIVIDIMQKEIQGAQALLQPPLNQAPLVSRNDARHKIERHDALRALIAAVNREGDALVEVGHFRQSPLGLERGGVHFRKTLQNF